MHQWVNFPYHKENELPFQGKYLFAVGGYHCFDNGCPNWGTADPQKGRFIGDCTGDLVITYTDGEADCIPLIFGYTLWFHSVWMENPAPFFGEEANESLVADLRSALALKGAWEGEKQSAFCIALPQKDIQSICIVPDSQKEGTPVFCGAYIADEMGEQLSDGEVFVDTGDSFFAEHLIKTADPYPEKCRSALERIGYALHTFDVDFESVPPYSADEVSTYPTFCGDSFAEIASHVVWHNMRNLLSRTDEDGFIHTSYQNAPSWRYDGFGPYVSKANSYFDSFYSRDGARAIMTLNSFGHTDVAESACNFGNKWMMYYPEQGLKLKGVPIPGHFSVIPNKPLIYSTFLAYAANWPTKYTKEAFGESFENLGNQETDGHGLMMMANHAVWSQLGCKAEWVRKNWTYINEAAEWILWCHQYPELSFSRDGLLYGETEAAMNDWTLYANVPCYLGLLGYAQMAEAIGETSKASLWREHAEQIRTQINKQLTIGEGWDMEHKGFHHDPVPAMLADMCGFDSADMPAEWISRSRAVYDDDVDMARKYGYYGNGGGIGYDHAMITQNALLLDQMADADRFVKALCKICYSPRLPEPYLVPEAVCVDAEKGVLRRQGDLANLVQLAEAMKCYLLVLGISPLQSKTLKVMPRLPENWGVKVSDFPIQNTTATITMEVAAPRDGAQKATVHLNGELNAEKLAFRVGPFPPNLQEAQVTINDVTLTCKTEKSGDSCWAWVELPIKSIMEVSQ